ncbi:MAG: hypothetical protein JOZ27_06485 [Caulobacteraceae bacterium]|nr:hypothetical protein [Caulobacteraceae bacterium]
MANPCYAPGYLETLSSPMLEAERRKWRTNGWVHPAVELEWARRGADPAYPTPAEPLLVRFTDAEFVALATWRDKSGHALGLDEAVQALVRRGLTELGLLEPAR